MKGSAGHDVLVELKHDIKRACEEGSLCTEYERTRVERMLDCSVRRGLGDRSELRGWRVLSLGQAINLVIEEDDIDVDVI